MNLIHRPVLSELDLYFFRFKGPGFGNLLFPLYRAFQAQKRTGGNLVFPQFRQIKLGPYIRREKDKRTYGDIFKRRTLSDFFLQAQSSWVGALHEDSVSEELIKSSAKTVSIEYRGLADYFLSFDVQYRDGFKDYLVGKSIYPLTTFDDRGRFKVAIHLRLGDFAAASLSAGQGGQMNFRTDISWYAKQVNLLRSQYKNIDFTLFTDESDLPNSYLDLLGELKVDDSPNALIAILRMAANNIILGSKSSFTLWGGYLGEGQVILPEDFDVDRYASTKQINFIRR